MSTTPTPTGTPSSTAPGAASGPAATPSSPGVAAPPSAPAVPSAQPGAGVAPAPATPAPSSTPSSTPAAPAAAPPTSPAGGADASVFGTPSPLDGVTEARETVHVKDPFEKPMGYGGLEKETAAQRRARVLAAAKAVKDGLPAPPATPAAAAAAAAAPGAPGVAPATPPAPAEGAFVFAGKTYKSRVDAENRLSTLEGKLRASEEGVTRGHGLTKAWIDHSERQEAIIKQLTARLQGGTPPAEGAPAGAPATPQSATPTTAPLTPEAAGAEFIKGFNWETFNDFYTDQKRGPGPALAYLADQMTQHMAKSQQASIAQIREELRPQLTALAGERQKREADTQITQIWSEAIQARDQQTGALVMPELANDPAALKEVKNIWLTHFPPAHIQNKDQANATMWAAYLIWNSQRQRRGTVAQVAATGAGAAAEAALNAATQGANAAAGAVGGTPVSSLPQPPSAMGGPGKPPTEEDVVKQSFRDAGNLAPRDPDGEPLGFDL